MKKEVYISGYAYPTISTDVMEFWKNDLSYINNFSYGITTDGSIVGLDDQFLIYAGETSGAENLMVLTPIDEKGKFNDELASSVLEDEMKCAKLIENIKVIILEKGLAGVDFDFEYIPRKNRDEYVTLVEKTREELNPIGAIVTVAVAPKIAAEQPGILYEGHSYEGLGAAADYVLIMTYEWGYTYGPAMAVAPINQVRRVVEYAISEIPSNKIWLGVPNYGYDFALPFVQGVSKAEKISNGEAIARAARYGADILYDEVAESPYYTYEDNNVVHEVWFENEASYRAKANLVYEYDLASIGIWNF